MVVYLGSLIVDAVVAQHINRTASPQILKYKRSKSVLSNLMYNVLATTLWYLSYGEAGKRFLFHLKFFIDFIFFRIKFVLRAKTSYLHISLFCRESFISISCFWFR